ncbi:MAG: hypothetical protein M3R30_09680 [Candidatus Eremiobacteraeota bacterium]|nr:hypothetical protein [Candidatus Eremiobacteraeota bacterium]
MIRSTIAALALVALCASVASADSPATPTLPVGVTVYVNASASTTDVDAWFTATKTAKNPSAGLGVLAAAKAAAGSTAVEDQGVAETMMGGSVETVKLSGAPGAVASARSKLQSAGFTSTAVSTVARDPDALRAEAYGKATKSARMLAEAAAAADGRHVGRLLNVVPSPMALLGDLTGMFGKVPQVQMMLDGGSAASASASVSGYYTFELVP